MACKSCKNKACEEVFVKTTSEGYWEDISRKGKTNVTQQIQKFHYHVSLQCYPGGFFYFCLIVTSSRLNHLCYGLLYMCLYCGYWLHIFVLLACNKISDKQERTLVYCCQTFTFCIGRHTSSATWI